MGGRRRVCNKILLHYIKYIIALYDSTNLIVGREYNHYPLSSSSRYLRLGSRVSVFDNILAPCAPRPDFLYQHINRINPVNDISFISTM